MAKLIRTICLALVALIVLLGVSGCGWNGKGEDVAAALLASSQVQTRAFSGSVELKSKSGFSMTFDGAIDSTDKNNPKMVMNMDSSGSATKIVMPGDGKIYMTMGGKSYFVPIPQGQASSKAVNPNKIYAALASAVGGFKEARSMTNHNGDAVDTVTATVSKTKLCGEVVESFGGALGETGGLGKIFGGDGSFKSICKSLLEKDPRVWFGIDDGKLTDVSLSARLNVPFAGSMELNVIYHEFNQNGSQTGFDAPAGATELSQSALGALPQT
ncbi:MAG: hypothetical protein QM648_06830 [Solirubrobacterales bacterium]